MSVETDPNHDSSCALHWECFDCGQSAGEPHAPDDMCRNRDERCTCRLVKQPSRSATSGKADR